MEGDYHGLILATEHLCTVCQRNLDQVWVTTKTLSRPRHCSLSRDPSLLPHAIFLFHFFLLKYPSLFCRNDIFVFLLSTRAGGLGINLTAADTVSNKSTKIHWICGFSTINTLFGWPYPLLYVTDFLFLCLLLC